MGRTRPLLIILLVVASVGIAPGTAVADDKWPDSCEGAGIIESGSYNGHLSPGDIDVFQIRVADGEPVTMNVRWDNAEASLAFIDISGAEVSVPSVDPAYISRGSRIRSIIFEDDDDQIQFRIFGEQDGTVCLPLLAGGQSSGVPTDWRVSLGTGQKDPERTDQQSIGELKTKLKQKNQRISELQSRVEELESQSSDGSSSDVTIQVTVTPANGQQFVEGGEAVVQAESENADVSEMAVEYGAGTYELDSSGEVAVPLTEAGTQEMTMIYGDTTERVSINVQSQDGQDQQDAPPTGVSGPGFGIVATLLALLGSVFLLQRYRQS